MTAAIVTRSSDAVTTCEPVRIHEGPYIVTTGEFMGITGFHNPRWVIATPNWHHATDIIRVPIDSEDVYVTDGCGRVIRRNAPATDFPDGY